MDDPAVTPGDLPPVHDPDGTPPAISTPSSNPFPWPAQVGAPRCNEADVPHLGVLFVHGVGYQLSGEIFHSSSGRLIRFLREAAYPDDPLRDPTRFGTRSIGWNEQPIVELELTVPRKDGPDTVVHWVLSEAFWAATFEPPSLGAVADWLGPGQAAARAARRLRYPGLRTGPEPTADTPPPESSITALEAMLSVGVAIVLGIYGLLRGVFAVIPIEALRTALIGPIDRFLTQWAGDMRIMLYDEGQAAIIRDRIARAMKTLSDFGCGEIAVVAHSGGVVSTYMTLTDPLYSAGATVPLYITYGQGLAVAWRLLGIGNTADQDLASRIGGRLADPLPSGISWRNYWATDDPVPAGPLDDPPPAAGRAQNFRVNNTWALREDHNAYFDNDEEFLLPLVEALWSRAPGGTWQAAVAQAGGTTADAIAAAAPAQRGRRLSRVAVHSIWKQLVASAMTLAILGAIATGLVGYWLDLSSGLSRPIEDVTDAISRTWSQVPGSGLIAGPLSFLRAEELWWLSLVGYIFWTAMLIAAVRFVLRPPTLDWITAAGARPAQRLGSLVTAFVARSAQFIAYAVGLPGLLGVSLASTPAWQTPFAQDVVNRGVRDVFSDLPISEPVAAVSAGITRNLLIFAALAAVAGAVYLSIRWVRRNGPSQFRLYGLTLYSAGVVFVVVAAFYALLVSPGFGSNVLGWAIIALVISTIGRVGEWRWHQWDLQERWEARAALRGATKSRRLGRRWDFGIFVVLSIGVLLVAFGFAIRPLVTAPATDVIFIGAGLVALAMFAGGVQDYINQEGSAVGVPSPDAPTAASQTID